MAFALEIQPAVDCHAKFFSQGGQKFVFRAMRLDGVRPPLDFNAKLELLNRFEKIRAAHTTGLVLSLTQADAVVDLAARARFVSLVEIDVAPEQIAAWSALAAARIADLMRFLRGRSGLFGYVVNCPLAEVVRTCRLRRIRRNLAALVDRIHESDDRTLVAVRRRSVNFALSVSGEDFIYADAGPLRPAEVRDHLAALHDIARERPVVLEFTEPTPEQDEAIAVAFAQRAAGVVAPRVPAAASSGSMDLSFLRPEAAMPFRGFGANLTPGLRARKP